MEAICFKGHEDNSQRCLGGEIPKPNHGTISMEETLVSSFLFFFKFLTPVERRSCENFSVVV